MSAGLGTRRAVFDFRLSSLNSFSRIPLQIVMQLSQIKTPGPAMSLRTSAWPFPQNEHIVRLVGRAMAYSDAFGTSLIPLISLREATTSSTSP